jgi:hypothetical protein
MSNISPLQEKCFQYKLFSLLYSLWKGRWRPESQDQGVEGYFNVLVKFASEPRFRWEDCRMLQRKEACFHNLCFTDFPRTGSNNSVPMCNWSKLFPLLSKVWNLCKSKRKRECNLISSVQIKKQLFHECANEMHACSQEFNILCLSLECQ